jgi:hypothetical protein
MASAVSKRGRVVHPGATHRFGVRRVSVLACGLQSLSYASRCAAMSASALLSLLALLALPTRSAAEDCRAYSDKSDCPEPAAFETPRGLALGTGVRAAAVSTSALAYSPGALALGNLYHIEANLDYLAALDTVALGAAAVDSSTSKVGAGIGLRGFLSGDDGFANDTRYDYDGLDGHLGVALALSDAFSLGIGARYIDLETEEDDDGDGMEDSDLELVEGFTMDASMRIVPVEGLQVDLAALNFIDRDSPFVPVMLTGGLAFSVGTSLSLGIDVLTDMSSFDKPQVTIGGGAEYLGGNSIPVRAGYSFDIAREVHALGVGIGYTDQRVGLDIGVRQEFSGGDDTRVMGAVRYYVN